MKKIRLSALSIAAAIISISFCTAVMAEGNVTISADKETCQINEEVTVSIAAEGGNDAASAPEISIVFDPNRLTFVDCSVPYGGGGGGLINITETAANVIFTTVSGGDAEITVNAVFDGDGTNPAGASYTISVEGEDTAALIQGESASQETGIEADTIASADGQKYVSSVFADEFMPVGFYKTTATYEEQMVEAAQFDMGDVLLLYVTDADGNNPSFDIYNQATGELTDFLQIMGIENKFIIAENAPSDVEVPKNFTKATLQWNDQVLEAYSYTGNADNLDIPATDFFLIYAISSEGNKGFYMYDQKEGTYQRYVSGLHGGKKALSDENQGGILAAITSSDEDGEESGLDIKVIIIGILALVALVLLILFIVTLVKLKDYESYDYIEEDEEYEPLNRRSMEMPTGNQPSFVRNQATENLPNLDEKPARGNSNTNKTEEKPSQKKITATDLVEREMTDDSDISESYVFDTRYRDDNDSEYVHENTSKDDRKLAKAEAKAAKKEAKRIKKQYGENGYVDWESFGEDVKKNDSSMPSFESNPKYVLDNDKKNTDNRAVKDVRNERAPLRDAEPSLQRQKPVESKPQRKPQNEYEQLRNEEVRKENPAEMMKNIPANDNNRPVQPKPVQQFDFDDDFEFEFLKLDDE